MKEKKQKKPLNKFLVLTGISFQMGATIYLFTYFGNLLDEKYPQNIKLYTLILTVLGVLISIYTINKQLQNINSKK